MIDLIFLEVLSREFIFEYVVKTGKWVKILVRREEEVLKQPLGRLADHSNTLYVCILHFLISNDLSSSVITTFLYFSS